MLPKSPAKDRKPRARRAAAGTPPHRPGPAGEFSGAVLAMQRVLAEELHDSVCQTLTGTALLVRILVQHARAGQPVPADDLQKVADLLNETLTDLRHFIQPAEALISGEALQAAVENYARFVAKRVPCRVEFSSRLELTDAAQGQLIFGMVRQLLRQVMKAAPGRSLLLEIHPRGKQLEIKVSCPDSDKLTAALLDPAQLHDLHVYAALVGMELRVDAGALICRVPMPGKAR